MSDGNHEVNRLRARAAYQEMVDKLERYETALEWYADRANYAGSIEAEDGTSVEYTDSPIETDGGQRARLALEGNGNA